LLRELEKEKKKPAVLGWGTAALGEALGWIAHEPCFGLEPWIR
jgi:hypothetical protein